MYLPDNNDRSARYWFSYKQRTIVELAEGQFPGTDNSILKSTLTSFVPRKPIDESTMTIAGSLLGPNWESYFDPVEDVLFRNPVSESESEVSDKLIEGISTIFLGDSGRIKGELPPEDLLPPDIPIEAFQIVTDPSDLARVLGVVAESSVLVATDAYNAAASKTGTATLGEDFTSEISATHDKYFRDESGEVVEDNFLEEVAKGESTVILKKENEDDDFYHEMVSSGIDIVLLDKSGKLKELDLSIVEFEGTTKDEVLDYYFNVGSTLLPVVRERKDLKIKYEQENPEISFTEYVDRNSKFKSETIPVKPKITLTEFSNGFPLLSPRVY